MPFIQQHFQIDAVWRCFSMNTHWFANWLFYCFHLTLEYTPWNWVACIVIIVVEIIITIFLLTIIIVIIILHTTIINLSI